MFDPTLHSGPRITIMTRLVILPSQRFGALQKSCALTAGNLANHLQVLESAGYLAQERDEKHAQPTKRVRITPMGETAFRAYIMQLKTLISQMDSRHP